MKIGAVNVDLYPRPRHDPQKSGGSRGPATFCRVASMTAGSRGKLSTRPAGSKPMDSGLDVLKVASYSKMVAVTKTAEYLITTD